MKYIVKIYDATTIDSDKPIIIEMKDFDDKKEAVKYAIFCEKTKVIDYVYYAVTTEDQIIFDTQYN